MIGDSYCRYPQIIKSEKVLNKFILTQTSAMEF